MPTKKENLKSNQVDKSWRDHGNSSRNADKRRTFIDCIQVGSLKQKALDYAWLSKSTVDDRLRKDPDLSHEYKQAKSNLYMRALKQQNKKLKEWHYNTTKDILTANDERYWWKPEQVFNLNINNTEIDQQQAKRLAAQLNRKVIEWEIIDPKALEDKQPNE